jgi:ParB family chromosome partitioning protein
MDSAEWYTPAPIVELARTLMGGIDLDPASCFDANAIVKASRYYTAAEDGLQQPWRGRVFVNAPGGSVSEYWSHLLCERRIGHVEEAIWVGYSLEQLQTLQMDGRPHPIEIPICIPSKRIAFIENDVMKERRKARSEAKGKPFNPRSTPSHGNYITYLGRQPYRFRELFSALGVVRI